MRGIIGLSISFYHGKGRVSMTNEEIAVAVKNGDSAYLPVLWDRMQRMIHRKAKQYRNKLSDDFNRSVDAEDLIQSGYFAVIEAVKHYDPEKEFAFSTYLGYDLKNAFRKATGTKTDGKRDANNYALPLDLPCGEGDDGCIVDLIEDPENQMQDVEECVYISELHAALDEALDLLTERQRIILTRRYYQGITYGRQAENEGISKQSVQYEAEAALEKIRRNAAIMSKLSSFLPHYDFDPAKYTGYSAWKDGGMSIQERHLIGQENKGCVPRERRWGENGATKSIRRNAMISAAPDALRQYAMANCSVDYEQRRQWLRELTANYRLTDGDSLAFVNQLVELHASLCLESEADEYRRRHNSFLMAYITDRKYSYKEIASIQGITRRTVGKDIDHVLEDMMLLAFGIDGIKPTGKEA